MRASSRLIFALVTVLIAVRPIAGRLFAQDQDAPQASQAGNAEKQQYDEDGEGKESDFVKKRMKWFHDQRAFPNKTIPPGIRARAIRERERKLEVEATAKQTLAQAAMVRDTTALTEPAWKMIGPEPENQSASGRITALAIDPTNTNTVYAGGAEGGVWKTTDAGLHWTPLGDTQPSLAIGSIAIDPSNHNTIYVGTGEENFAIDNYYGAGILKSTNGGATWTQLVIGSGGENCGGDWIGAVAVHPTNSKIVLAGVEGCWANPSGILRSADGGTTWTQVLEPASGSPVTGIIFDHTNGSLVYASTIGGGVYKSLNGGATWSAANGAGSNAIPTSNQGRIAIAMTPSNTSTLYAAVANNQTSDLLGMYKTVDGGANWTLLQGVPNFCATQCWYDIVLAVSPSNPNVVAAGGVFPYHPGGRGVMISLDGGNSWADHSNTLHPDTHALAFTPDGLTLYVGSDGGVWNATNPTSSVVDWIDLNNTLAITEFYPGISMDQSNVNHSNIGTQDNGTEQYSGSLNWDEVSVCGDGGPTAIDYTSPSTIYTNCIGQSLYKTTDSVHWVNATTGISANDRTAWVPPLAMDPKTPANLYFGTYRVYQTKNGAASWSAISPDLTGTSGEGELNTIAVAPTDPNTVYTGADSSKIYVTRNALAGAGAKWTEVTSPNLPNRTVNWIAVDPASASIAFAGFSGFTGFGDSLGHIFETKDAGSTWTDISGDLPNTPVDAILVDPDATATIFVGTDIGVFYTTNTGSSWSRLGTGLPNVVVTGLGLHEASRTLRAATHGRSVWDLNVATLLPIPTLKTVSPSTFTADSAAVKVTVKGVQFISTSAVVWNGKPLVTTFVSSSEVTATVPAADLVAAGTATIGVVNGTGGKLSNLTTVAIDNPVPALTSLSKTSALVGSAGFTLTVNGSNFVNGSKIEWKGTALTTTFTSVKALSAPIPASDLAKSGTAAVTVLNAAPGGGTSAALTFTIDNPVPVAGSLSPATAIAGSAAIPVIVTGSNFVAGTQVLWNGTALSTTVESATKLKVTVLGSKLVTAGTVLVTVKNPTPGGGASAATLKFTIDNPVPVASSLSPASVIAGSAAIPVTVTGSGFVATTQIFWNGAALSTTFESATRIKATVLGSKLVSAGTVPVTVKNPAPGGGTSAATLKFVIDNPVPAATTLAPTSAKVGGIAFTLTVNGSNFVKASQVKWNGTALVTTYVSATRLTAAVTAADIAKATTASVTVTSPTPGGGTTTAIKFPVQ